MSVKEDTRNKVLIVDDMQTNIMILMNILGDQYEFLSATNGKRAMALMRENKPDLVLLDLYMPGIDGFEVFRCMKENPMFANIPVIFVSSEHRENMEEQGLALGAVDYIKKPYNESIVRIKVRNHLEMKAYRDNLELLVQQRTKQLAASREGIIMGISLMSENHDRVTGDHIKRIKFLTGIIARQMLAQHPESISPELVEQTILFSPMHDIGKIGISDIILKKTGLLTPEEFDTMKMHTVDGANIIHEMQSFMSSESDVNDLKVAQEIAESHHEKYDGSGYPSGLKGEDIPLSARIVSIADVYDALRSPRPYKKAFSHEESLDIILIGDGRTDPRHFDPYVLQAFRQMRREIEEVYE